MVERKEQFSARRDDLVVEELGGELLIYDRRTDVAHSLGAVAAVAWRAFEAGATVDHAATQILANDLASSLDEARTLAAAATAELLEKDLLEQAPHLLGERIPRRQALRRIVSVGAAAATGPLVLSAVVPNAFAAGSGIPSTIYFCKNFSGQTGTLYCFEITTSSKSCSPVSSIPTSGTCGSTQPGGTYFNCSDLNINYGTSSVTVQTNVTGEYPNPVASYMVCGSKAYHPTGSAGNDSVLTFSCNSPGASC